MEVPGGLINASAILWLCHPYNPMTIKPRLNRMFAVDGKCFDVAIDHGFFIKADPCSDITQYHRVVEVAGDVPILVRGGGKAPDAEIIERTVELMKQGAKGIVYGRNVIQHEKPTAMTQALMSIVHEGADTKTALGSLERN